MTQDVRNLSDGLLTVQDGSSTPKTLQVALDDGSLKMTRKRKVDPIYNRQAIVANREGKHQMHDISFKTSFNVFSGDTSGTTPSLYEVLYGLGLAATLGWTGADAAAGSAYCVNIIFQITAPTGAVEKSETITIGKFFIDSYDFAEGEGADTVDIKGKCVTITSTRQ